MNNINRKEFDILELYLENKQSITQREIEAMTDYSLSTINRIIKGLTDKGYVKNGFITNEGLSVMEQFKVKRAVILAAGFGSRLVPVTLNTPKPLVRVNGVRIIDKILDACLNIGINEIYIVRGYLSEQFDQLLYKYPMIKLLENPTYNEANNISSAMVARYLMQNAYVFESDLLIENPEVIKKYHYQSDVLGIWKERTDDWCLDVDKDGNVVEEKIGGINTYQMVGIYYFNETDGAKLADHIEQAYNFPGGKERYWETVPNQVFKGEYKISVIPCNDKDVIEIDTFRELKEIDKTYDV